MRVVPPLKITDALLTSSGVVEPAAPAAYNPATAYAAGDIVAVAADFTIYESLEDANTGHTPKSSPTWWRILGPTETAYNAATAYALGDTVYSADTHRCYESLQAGNTGNPLPVPPETQTAWWIDVGPTNKWAMFDLLRNTQTVCASPLTVTVTPGQRIDSVALLGLAATSVTVELTNGGATTYYTRTEDLNAREIADWYDYFFEPFGWRPSVVLFDLPPFSDGVLNVTIANSIGNAKCGALVVGSYQYIGAAQYNGESDALNFSTVDRDAYGTATLVRRRSIPKATISTIVNKGVVNAIRDLRTALNAEPAVWSGWDDTSDDYAEAFLILGFYRKFTINAAYPTDAVVGLELEEI